jgi:hypothetical protein
VGYALRAAAATVIAAAAGGGANRRKGQGRSRQGEIGERRSRESA